MTALTATPATIRISAETYRRLQSLASGFRADALGTPDKVISMLLDSYEQRKATP